MKRELIYRYGSEGTDRYISILLLFSEYPERQVKQTVSICVKCRAFSDETVSNFLHNDCHLDLSGNKILINKGDGKHSLSVYDNLVREGYSL